MLTAAPASAQPQPTAIYEASLREGRPGDTFDVALTVEWVGGPEALDIPIPRPVETPGLRFRMLGSESRQDGPNSRVRFRWQVAAQEPDTYAIDRLIPVVVYPRDSSTPLTLRAVAPLTVRITPRPSAGKRVATVAGGVAGLGTLAAAVLLLGRRRRAHRAADASEGARRAIASHEDAAFAEAVRLRTAGEYAAYLDGLLALAEAEDSPSVEAVQELKTLRERIAFGSYQPTTQELDRVANLVERMLKRRRAPEEHV